jgi:PAS domain S-box-containing protein
VKQAIYKKIIPSAIFAVLSGSLFLFVIYHINNQIESGYEQKRRAETEQEVKYLERSISNLILIRNRELHTTMRSANAMVNPGDSLQVFRNDSINMPVLIKNTGITQNMYLPHVLYNGRNILGDKKLSGKIRKFTNGHYNIYIKVRGGYVQILDNERNTGEFIPEYIHSGHPAALSIENETEYLERLITNFDSRRILYKPLYINGTLNGIIKCSIDEGISGYLSKTFQNLENSEKQLFLIKTDGTPILQNDAASLFKDEHLTEKLFNNRSYFSEISYHFDTPQGIKNRMIHYAYLQKYDMYAGILLPKNAFVLLDTQQKLTIYLAAVLVFLLLNGSFIFFTLRQNREHESIIESARAISEGKPAEAKHKVPDNSAGKALYEIITYLEHLTEYALAIVQDKNYKHYSPGKDDVPGQALNKLKADKDKLKERGLIKKFTGEIKKKTEKGKTEINELLQYANDIKELSSKVIQIIYDIIEVDQIGFFLVKIEDSKKYLELQAAFAYNEERFFNEKISAENSLTGRAVMEKESVFLKDLPPDYTMLSGGFGQTAPRNLAIVPLIFNNEVQAIIEIAALKEIRSYQIKFLENIGESIASTISNIRNSKQTEALLKQTEEQSKQIEIQRVELQEKIETHRRQNRRIDKELNEKRELLNSIQKSAFLIELNLRGEVLSINKNMLELFGVKEPEWQGRKHKELIVCENYAEKYGGFFRDLSKDKTKYRIEEITLKKGVSMKFSVIYTPLRNARGRIKAILLMAHKIDFEA